jgi:DNA primase
MAGRIPQSFIDDLLDRVDIVEVIDRRVKLKKSGKNYTARCPFHDEKTPSFSVNPDKQFYYCFGCGAGGNALGFVMDYENVDFPQAVETLAASVGLDVPREQPRSPAARQEEQAGRQLYPLLEQVARYYQLQLRQHPEARRAVDYLKGRGLSGIIARQFGLGFAPPGWDNLLKAMAGSEEQQKLLLQTGMLVENEAGRVYDRFRDRVMFPIRDQRGRVVAFGGRVLGDDKPKYLNSPETEVFHKGRELYGLYEARQANRKLDRLLVVEGYMDVIALAKHGINNAVATLGTATSRTHLERIFRLCPEVVFCFDGDEAGRKAAQRAMEAALPCMQDGRQARFLFLPEGEDPDTLVRARGAEHLLHLVSEATPLEEFLFHTAAQGIDTASLEGRARLSRQALPYLRELPAGVYRQLMFKALADRTGLPLEELLQLEQPEPAQPPPPAAPPPGRVGNANRPRQRPTQSGAGGFTTLAQSALALLLHKPEIARLVDAGTLREHAGPDIDLLRDVLALLKERPDINTAMLLGHWYGTPEGELLSRLAGQERLIPADGIEQQFVDTVALLAQQPQRSNLDAYIDKLRLTNYADLSDLEKLQLKELLQLKQQLDAQRSGGR